MAPAPAPRMSGEDSTQIGETRREERERREAEGISGGISENNEIHRQKKT